MLTRPARVPHDRSADADSCHAPVVKRNSSLLPNNIFHSPNSAKSQHCFVSRHAGEKADKVQRRNSFDQSDFMCIKRHISANICLSRFVDSEIGLRSRLRKFPAGAKVAEVQAGETVSE